jgi:hypothetical protein
MEVIKYDFTVNSARLPSLCDHIVYIFSRTRNLIDALKAHVAGGGSLKVNGDDVRNADNTRPPAVMMLKLLVMRLVKMKF